MGRSIEHKWIFDIDCELKTAYSALDMNKVDERVLLEWTWPV